MLANANRLLIIDDEIGVSEFIIDVAEEMGFEVAAVDNLERFVSEYEKFQPTVVLIDLVMPEVDGVEILRLLAKRGCKAAVGVMSGMDKKVLATAEWLGKDHGLKMIGAIQKPVRVSTLEKLLGEAWDNSKVFGEEELAEALTKRQLVLHYQPVIRLQGDKELPIEGVEALVRWNHPKHGLVYPDEFIELAEQTGLISLLTDFVLEETIAQMKFWEAAGLILSVSINMSPQTLTDIELPDRLASQIAAAGVDPARIVLEITERAAMDDDGVISDILTRIRLKNIGLSMDDFGTGYSSLAKLHRMPFSELKIDHSFVGETDTDEDAKIIVRSIVDLARNLGMSTCAEGVETLEALEYCRSLGCDKVQGFYISKALPGNKLSEFIRQWEKGETRRGLRLVSNKPDFPMG